MDTSAELTAWPKPHDTYLVAVFFAKECYRTHLLCLLDWCVAMFVERQILSYHVIYQPLNLPQFLVGNFLKV